MCIDGGRTRTRRDESHECGHGQWILGFTPKLSFGSRVSWHVGRHWRQHERQLFRRLSFVHHDGASSKISHCLVATIDQSDKRTRGWLEGGNVAVLHGVGRSRQARTDRHGGMANVAVFHVFFSIPSFKNDVNLNRWDGIFRMNSTRVISVSRLCFWNDICTRGRCPGRRCSTWSPKCSTEDASRTIWIVSCSPRIPTRGWIPQRWAKLSPSTLTRPSLRCPRSLSIPCRTRRNSRSIRE